MKTTHFHQPRGYVEDFLDKILLHMIGSQNWAFITYLADCSHFSWFIRTKTPGKCQICIHIAWNWSDNPNVSNAYV